MTGAADAIAARLTTARAQPFAPAVGLILGSGLGGSLVIDDATRVSFADIALLRAPTVAGHRGEFVLGRLGGRDIVVMAGRLHSYEGLASEAVTLPVRAMHALGVDTLLVSNAAGAIRPTFAPGSLVVLRDHINLMWRNPLIGPLHPGDERLPDMSTPYDPGLRHAFARAASTVAGLELHEGVYAAVLGPSYETPAEIRMLERMGADVVGMSTVPEVLVARALGLRVLGVSCVTNAAAGTTAQPLSHADVLEVGRRIAPLFGRAVEAWLKDNASS
jgi:purine-nucleoside phosphorylase